MISKPVEIEEKDEAKKSPDEYQIKDACETILRAEEIKNDKALWPLVQEKLKSKGHAIKKVIKSLGDLNEVAYEKSKESDSDATETTIG